MSLYRDHMMLTTKGNEAFLSIWRGLATRTVKHTEREVHFTAKCGMRHSWPIYMWKDVECLVHKLALDSRTFLGSGHAAI